MAGYNRLLLAVDLTEESNVVSSKASEMAELCAAELHVVHVLEPISLAYGGDVPMDLSSVQEQIHEQAQAHLTDLGSALGVPPERQHLIFGRPENEIHRTAESIDADLIVVGSHGRAGLALLLGSTANGVLHGATIDVLAVHVGNSDAS